MLLELALNLILQEPSDCVVIDASSPPEQQALRGMEPVCQSDARALLEPQLSSGSEALTARIGHPDDTVAGSNGTVQRWFVHEMMQVGSRESLGGGGAGAMSGYSTSTMTETRCVVAVAWSQTDQPLGWRIEGNAYACERILRWLR